MQAAITARLAKLHAEEPLRPYATLNDVSAGAAPKPETRACFRLALNALLDRGEVVSDVSSLLVRLRTHRPQWVGRFAVAREKILAKCLESGIAAPSVPELATLAGLSESECVRTLDALVEVADLCMLGGNYLHPECYWRAEEQVKEFLAKNGKMNIAQARELLGASRKYLLPFLEDLDYHRVTARQGDFRVLGGQ
jgi:selenocysteine-specific elongation factor